MELKMKSVKELKPYAKNSRTHSDEQISQLVESIKEFGFNNPILLDGDNGIIAGHGRLLAAIKAGYKEVPTIELKHLNPTQKKAYIIADNQLALNAGWDFKILEEQLRELIEEDFNYDLLGFSEKELSKILEPLEVEGNIDDDEVPETNENELDVRPGDIWILGNHRLMCGDSTNVQHVDKLMDGKKADMVFTDPPYGIDEETDRAYASRTRIAKGNSFKKIYGDKTIDVAVNCFHLVQSLNISRQVWWGGNYYCHSLPQTGNWFVWDKRVEEKQRDVNSDCELAWVKSKWASVRIFRHLWKGIIKDSEHGIKRIHPTQKPIALAEWSFDYFKDVKSVLDLFLGSGSTLIACEKTNRICYGMEIDPHYCSVIIKRWQEFTGKEAIREEEKK